MNQLLAMCVDEEQRIKQERQDVDPLMDFDEYKTLEYNFLYIDNLLEHFRCLTKNIVKYCQGMFPYFLVDLLKIFEMKKTDQGQPRRLRLVLETSLARREEAGTSGDVPSTCRGVSQGRSRLSAFQSRLSQRRQKGRFQGMRASRLRRTRSRLSQGFQRTCFFVEKTSESSPTSQSRPHA